jgi:drug/metabolite transporter (DMT)-like permease
MDRRLLVVAFAILVVLVGTNTVAIRYSNRELDPFWNAAIRFVIAAAVFGALAAWRRPPWPGSRAALGSVAYGVLAFVLFFAFLYAGLEEVTVGMAQTILALGPLLTLAIAVAVRLERPTARAVAGGLIAVAGVGIAFAGELAASISWTAVLLVALGATSFALAGIVAKRLPRIDSVLQNAIGTFVAAILLLGLSAAFGERQAVPRDPGTWLAIVYLALPGTVLIFLLFLTLVRAWKATTVAYQFVLAPIVSISLAAVLLDEPMAALVLAGAAVVVAGVWIGALSGRSD